MGGKKYQDMNERRYPVGIQTFSEIIAKGMVYVDKTDIVWRLTHENKYVFLNRPRRFGKSLLATTLKSYFEGRRDLFEGLKIMQLEQEWTERPVISLSLSQAKSQSSAEALQYAIGLQLVPFEKLYGRNTAENTPGQRLRGIVQRAVEQTGRQAVVIIDEYDAPLLEVLHEEENLKEFRRIMQEFYVPLKDLDPYLQFCFITGITKFSQLSIFSTINNLNNISMLPQYATICGITEEELATTLAEDTALLAESYGCTPAEMHQRLQRQYDGYHFSHSSSGVYNPFSLMKAFLNKDIANYWFDSGTPSYLIRQMQHFRTDITVMDNMEVSASAFDRPTEAMTTALPLLYQSGYLTIKDYDRETMLYQLSIPNQEVRVGYTEGLLPTYVGLEGSDVQTGFAVKFWRSLKRGDIQQAMLDMQSFMAGLPYVDGFKKKLEAAAQKEAFYEYTMYLIFSMLNVYARTQVRCAGGRVDMVVQMPDATYVFELKKDGTPREALQQIDSNSYAIPYKSDGRRVVKIGVRFNVDTRVPEEWEIAE